MRRWACVGLATLMLGAACSEPSSPATSPSHAASASSAPAASASATTSSAATPSASASASAAAEPPEPPAIPAPNPPIQLAHGGKSAVASKRGLVTSVEANATRAGVKVLEDGGNAIDAAVATAYALAVTHPSAGNLGGGGFMIVRLKTGETYAIDFRETAPAAATTKKVVDEIKAGAFGWASVAIPGTVAGLDLAREKFGTKPLADLLAPAIKLAKKGHKVTARAAMSLKAQWSSLEKDPAARAIWGKKKGPLKAGDKVVQADLAKTLEAIAEKGDAGFYDGPVADLIDAAMKKNGGDVTKDELKTYKAKLREPLRFSYRGFTIDTMPPPSMGGVAVAETLLQLERAGASDAPLDSTRFFHLFVEAAKRSYADRRIVGADPDFYGDKVSPGALERLLGARYLVYREPKIDPDKATPATAFEAASDHKESPETTHFSVVDAEGNAVSCTVTLSASFGSKVMAPGTGFFFSNALGAFSETGSNEVAPHKRMASSMSPTVLSRDGKVEAVVGSPGGDTIPNTVAQVIRNLVDYHMTVDEAVLHGRVHHQLLPDVIRYEVGRDPPANVIKELEKLGHKLEGNAIPLGDAKIIVRDPATGEAWGFADPREGGLALGPP